MNCEKEQNEVIDKLKSLIGGAKKQGHIIVRIEDIEKIIPEAKESEDDKVRKALVKLVNAQQNDEMCLEYGAPKKDCIAFLEKQENPDTLIQKAYELGYTEGKRIERKRWREKKYKFDIGDIISDGQAVFRVDNIVKNCIGQDSYFLVNVELEKKGLRYGILIDSEGKRSYAGEITWLCEQVDRRFEKQAKTDACGKPYFNALVSLYVNPQNP